MEKARLEPQRPQLEHEELYLAPLLQQDVRCEPLLLPQEHQHRQGPVFPLVFQEWVALERREPTAW